MQDEDGPVKWIGKMLNIVQKFRGSQVNGNAGRRTGRVYIHGSRSMAGEFASGLWMLLLGIFVGALLMAIFLGFRSGAPTNIGAGLRGMVDNRPSARIAENAPVPPTQQPARQQQTISAAPKQRETIVSAPKANSSVTFHEVLSTESNVLPRPVERQTTREVKVVPKPSTPEEELTASYQRVEPSLPASGTYYMLQVGSFVRYEEADRLKAQLTIAGLDARIQTATVKGTGVFRVRVGPYASYSDLGIVENRVRGLGHNPIQVKVSQN